MERLDIGVARHSRSRSIIGLKGTRVLLDQKSGSPEDTDLAGCCESLGSGACLGPAFESSGSPAIFAFSSQAGAAVSFAMRSRLYAAPPRWAASCVLSMPRNRVFRKFATVLSQPKISSTRFRARWLIW